MINRLNEYFVQPDGRWREEDEFFVICHSTRNFFVSRAMATRVIRDLESTPMPAWIRFTDLSGSSVSVRSCMIEYVRESTFAQRSSEWQFYRTRRQEYRQHGYDPENAE